MCKFANLLIAYFKHINNTKQPYYDLWIQLIQAAYARLREFIIGVDH